MKTIEVTREQVQQQLSNDILMDKEIGSRFHSVRVSQLKNILENGEGIFSLFVNEEAKVIIRNRVYL